MPRCTMKQVAGGKAFEGMHSGLVQCVLRAECLRRQAKQLAHHEAVLLLCQLVES